MRLLIKFALSKVLESRPYGHAQTMSKRDLCLMPNSLSIENIILNQQYAQHLGNIHIVMDLQVTARDRKNNRGRRGSFVVVEGGGKGDEP